MTVIYIVIPQPQPASLATVISTPPPSLIHTPGDLQNF